MLVIEHNLDVIKTADWIVDMGPDGGSRGGTVVAEGTPEDVAAQPGELHRRLPRPLLEGRGGEARTSQAAAKKAPAKKAAAKRTAAKKAAAKKTGSATASGRERRRPDGEGTLTHQTTRVEPRGLVGQLAELRHRPVEDARRPSRPNGSAAPPKRAVTRSLTGVNERPLKRAISSSTAAAPGAASAQISSSAAVRVRPAAASSSAALRAVVHSWVVWPVRRQKSIR